MDIRVGHTVIAQTMDSLYKQSVEYCCGSLLSSLVKFPHYIHLRDLLTVQSLVFVTSGCQNKLAEMLLLAIWYALQEKRKQSKFTFFQHNVQYSFTQFPKTLEMLLDYQLTFKKSSLSSVLKLFKDNNIYKVVDLPKKQKVIKNPGYLTSSLTVIIDLNLL